MTELAEIQSAREYARSLKGSGSDFFDRSAREVIAQSIATLAAQRGAWTKPTLIAQIAKPRNDFDPAGLADGLADEMFFHVEASQRAAILATAAFIVSEHMPDMSNAA